MATDRALIQQNLKTAMERRCGQEVAIENLRLLTGGASAQSWWFDSKSDARRYAGILRMRHGRSGIGLDKTTEAAVQNAAGEHGVPVAPVCFVLDDQDNLGQGYVMERISGETIARKILRDPEFADARRRMARQCGEILRRVHDVDRSRLPPLPDQSTTAQLEELRTRYDGFGQDLPVFEVALRWLADHPPRQVEPTLVHGDFRNGNFVVGPDGIRAVLDWELAHLGDPMEDLGWLCVNSWRFGNIDQPVGGFGSREELMAGYESAGDRRVDVEVVHYWEVLGTLRWGVICLIQTFAHLSGETRSVERAAIGRRVSETELDLLNLLS